MDFRRVLILKADGLGDFLLAVPALRALRKAWPDARLEAVLSPPAASLARPCPYLDAVRVREARWLSPGARPLSRWTSAGRLLAEIRREGFDAVVALRWQSRLDPLLAALSGASLRAGFARAPAASLLTHVAGLPPPQEHQILRTLRILDALGVPRDGEALEYWTGEEDRLALERRLGGPPPVNAAAVQAGTGLPSKDWNAGKFGALAAGLRERLGLEVFVLGGPGDRERGASIAAAGGAWDLTGSLTWGETAALLERCRLFVGGDTGVTHLAAALGTPVVSLFSGVEDPAVWAPAGKRVRILGDRPSCSPCRSPRCRRTDGYFCMDRIDVEEVLEACGEILRDRSPGSPT